MKCPNCGAEIPDIATFCPECGATINKSETAKTEEKPDKVEKASKTPYPEQEPNERKNGKEKQDKPKAKHYILLSILTLVFGILGVAFMPCLIVAVGLLAFRIYKKQTVKTIGNIVLIVYILFCVLLSFSAKNGGESAQGENDTEVNKAESQIESVEINNTKNENTDSNANTDIVKSEAEASELTVENVVADDENDEEDATDTLTQLFEIAESSIDGDYEDMDEKRAIMTVSIVPEIADKLKDPSYSIISEMNPNLNAYFDDPYASNYAYVALAKTEGNTSIKERHFASAYNENSNNIDIYEYDGESWKLFYGTRYEDTRRIKAVFNQVDVLEKYIKDSNAAIIRFSDEGASGDRNFSEAIDEEKYNKPIISHYTISLPSKLPIGLTYASESNSGEVEEELSNKPMESAPRGAIMFKRNELEYFAQLKSVGKNPQDLWLEAQNTYGETVYIPLYSDGKQIDINESVSSRVDVDQAFYTDVNQIFSNSKIYDVLTNYPSPMDKTITIDGYAYNIFGKISDTMDQRSVVKTWAANAILGKIYSLNDSMDKTDELIFDRDNTRVIEDDTGSHGYLLESLLDGTGSENSLETFENTESLIIQDVTKQEATTSSDDLYILPESDKSFVDETKIEQMDQSTLRLAINEIYARHGRIFDSEDLNAYFNSQPWYTPTKTADQFDNSCLNEYEKKNLQTLSKYRK